jgi:hypothetical protein
MIGDNLALYVATYSDAASAREDFEALKAAESDDLAVVGAVVMSRGADGKVDVLEKGDATVAGGALLGGSLGLVVGLFAPPLLAATAVGAGIGAGLGYFTKKQLLRSRGGDRQQVPRPRRVSAHQVGQTDHQGHRLRGLREAQEGGRQVGGRRGRRRRLLSIHRRQVGPALEQTVADCSGPPTAMLS